MKSACVGHRQHCDCGGVSAQILDIGGKPVTTTLSSEPEVPPIPCHVHNGVVVDGVMRGPGKLEAYFYPPVDVPPYNLSLTGCVTRLGVKPTVDRDDMLAAMEEFGQNDRVYGLLNRCVAARVRSCRS